MSRNINPIDLDKFIFKTVDWKELTDIHDKKEAKMITINTVKLNVTNLLLYIRSYSRVLIDYFTGLRKNNTSKPFYTVVAGSTNLTSDYDVTLIGEKAYSVCKDIVVKFYKCVGKNLADVADSNIYISPGFVVRSNYKYPEWFKYVLIEKEQAFPLPLSNIAIKQEIKAVMDRFDLLLKPDNRSIYNRYLAMIKTGKELEEKYYYNKTKVTYTEENFWKLLHKTHFNAMEGYIALSTILSVVVEIQMGKTIKELKPIHYLISSFENMINYLEHSHMKDISELSTQSPSSLLKNSKYIYRTALALNKTNMKNEYLSQREINTITKIVSQRGSPVNEINSQLLEDYKKIVKKVLSKLQLVKLSLSNYEKSLKITTSSKNIKTQKRTIRKKSTKSKSIKRQT